IRIERERRFVGMPRLPGQREIVAGSEKIWLLEVHTDALVERGIAGLDAGGACAAGECHVPPVDLDATFFFAAVPNAEIDLPVFSLGHGHTRWHIDGLLVGTQRLHVGEVEELRTVEFALTLLQRTLPEQLAGAIRELAPDDIVADAGVALDFYGSETRQLTGVRGE